MAILEIPLRNDIASYEYNIDIEDENYILELKYNARSSRWNINIYDTDRDPIISGLILLTDTDIKSQYVNEELFPGLLLMYDKKDEQQNAKRNDLGDRVILLYEEES